MIFANQGCSWNRCLPEPQVRARGAGCDGCYGFKQNMMAELKKGTGRCPNCDGQGPSPVGAIRAPMLNWVAMAWSWYYWTGSDVFFPGRLR